MSFLFQIQSLNLAFSISLYQSSISSSLCICIMILLILKRLLLVFFSDFSIYCLSIHLLVLLPNSHNIVPRLFFVVMSRHFYSSCHQSVHITQFCDEFVWSILLSLLSGYKELPQMANGGLFFPYHLFESWQVYRQCSQCQETALLM